MPHQAIKFDALEHLKIGSKPVWGFSKPGRWFFEAKWPNSNTQWNFRHTCDTRTKYWHETNSGIMMDNLAKTNCFTNRLRKLTDVVQARQDNPKQTHTHTQFCKHLMTHRGLQILPFVCNQMYVNSTMRAVLKNMSHPAFGPKGEGARRAKNRRRDLGYGILFLPSLIRLGLQSWTTVWNQPLPVPGTRVPGKFPELRVPGTKVRGKVPGSGNQTFKQGSGNNGFSPPFGFRDVKVPGSPGSRRQGGSGHTWLSTRFREPYLPWFRAVLESPEHQFWNILETQSLGNKGSGKVPATLGSDKVPRTTADEDPQFGYTSWIMPQVPDRDKVPEQQFSRSPAQVPENKGSGKVPRFRKQPRGRIYAVGCTKFMLRTGSQKTNFQETKVPGPYRPFQRAIADRVGHSVTINQRVSVPQTQGSNSRCGLCQGSGNEGSRKTRFQEHKGFRKSPSQSWVLCGGFRTCRFMFVCSVGAQRRSTDLFWCCCKIFCFNGSDVASTKAHATSSN